MARRDFFAHENPDGEHAWDRWEGRGCTAAVGENLAKTYLGTETRGPDGEVRSPSTATDVAELVVDLWRDSPAHDDLLLADWPDAVGVGVHVEPAGDGGHVVYVTLNVCAVGR